MKSLSINAKLFSIIGIFTFGFVAYIVFIMQSTKLTLQESDFHPVMEMKDLIADALPPPIYTIEAYLIALRLPREADKHSRSELLAQWKKLERDQAERQAYWKEALPPGQLRTATTERANRTALRVFALGNEQLFPALEAGDTERVNAALASLESAYLEHRAAIDELVALADQAGKNNAADAEHTIYSRTVWRVSMGVVIILIGCGLGSLLARQLTRRIRAMATVLTHIGHGDMTQRVHDDEGDELGRMAGAVNHALEAIEHAFLEVRRVSTTLAQTAASLARSAEHISNGAQSQAASLEETAASLEEITATVKQNTNNAQQANQVAVSSRDVAERGGGVVSDAVAAMDQITQSSRQIGEIITTIDEIALQTNLLALNAAVEAARAGEQGRGFAVVAAEVGNLAQRSAAAAKEVKTLIHTTLQRVEAGHELVGESGRALQDIIGSVKKVTDLVGEIAAAAREQSIGVDQVNQAVSQMDQVTQSNAAQTQELTRTADGLAVNASELRELLARFQLRDFHDSDARPQREAPPKPYAARKPAGAKYEPANDSFSPPVREAKPRLPLAASDDGGSDFEVT